MRHLRSVRRHVDLGITPLVHQEVVDRWGVGLVEVIDDASSRLTTAEVRELNWAASRPDSDVAAVVAAWWSQVAS